LPLSPYLWWVKKASVGPHRTAGTTKRLYTSDIPHAVAYGNTRLVWLGCDFGRFAALNEFANKISLKLRDWF